MRDDLRCPFCGGRLRIWTEMVAHIDKLVEEPVCIECVTSTCPGEWQVNGDLRRGPSKEDL